MAWSTFVNPIAVPNHLLKPSYLRTSQTYAYFCLFKILFFLFFSLRSFYIYLAVNNIFLKFCDLSLILNLFPHFILLETTNIILKLLGHAFFPFLLLITHDWTNVDSLHSVGVKVQILPTTMFLFYFFLMLKCASIKIIRDKKKNYPKSEIFYKIQLIFCRQI